MSKLNEISFCDLMEPDLIMVHFMYETIIDAIRANLLIYDNNMEKCLQDIHLYVDESLLAVSVLYTEVFGVSYGLTYVDDRFVFTPGNLFTCKIGKLMELQNRDSILHITIDLV